jgi:hypothetical protein
MGRVGFLLVLVLALALALVLVGVWFGAGVDDVGWC